MYTQFILDEPKGLEMTTDYLKAAYAAGQAAYANGIPCAPVLDSVCVNLISETPKFPGFGGKILKEWHRGWARANLAAPMES